MNKSLLFQPLNRPRQRRVCELVVLVVVGKELRISESVGVSLVECLGVINVARTISMSR